MQLPSSTLKTYVRKPESILLIGPPGGGKTTLLLQFPNLALADVDDNLNGPADLFRTAMPDKELKIVSIVYDEAGKVLPLGDRWGRLFEFITAAVRDPWVRTIGIDSLTQINTNLINQIFRDQKRETMEQRDWIPFRQELIKCMMLAKTSGKNFVLTAHEEVEELKDTKGKIIGMRRKPSVVSKLSDYFGYLFTNVWRCSSTPAGMGRVTFEIRTRATTIDDLKASVQTLPHDITCNGLKTFEELNKHLHIV